MINFAIRLVKGRRGVAAVEFSLWSTLILGALLPCLDFATYLVQSERLSGAIGQASMLGYNMRSGVISADQLSQYASASSGSGSAATVTVTCNGGLQNCATAPSMRACVCVGLGAPLTYVPSTTCGSSCGNGATSGFYLTVRGVRAYRAMLPSRWLNGKAIMSSTTVRLQ